MSTDGSLARRPGETRDALQGLILADLLGPAGGEHEEVLESRVSERYAIGMLAPRRLGLGAATAADHQPEAEAIDDELAVAGAEDGEEGRTEPPAPAVEQLVPSSLGLSFAVAPGTDLLDVVVAWGAYKRGPSDELETETGRPRRVWKRLPAGGTRPIRLAPGDLKPFKPDSDHPEVIVRGRVRDRAGLRLVTLFLVNDQLEPASDKDEAWVFQPELRVSADGRPVFVSHRPGRPPRVPSIDADELADLDMLYRDEVELAVGHNVGVHAVADLADSRRGTELRTAVAPSYELPLSETPTAEDNPDLATVTLDIRTLAEAEPAALPALLTPLVDAYERWIDRQAARIGDRQARLEGHEQAADRALERCRAAATRIRVGIEALADPDVAEAFRVANEAMWRQRVHGLAAGERARTDAADIAPLLERYTGAQHHSWRSFQLAFILLNLPGVARLDHPDRGDPGLADLLWFPTGGGKTEAYLGLTAFTLALRRLRGHEGGRDGRDGVGVLMRYTLRLLTLQQFQRATALICALEVIRRERLAAGERRWGDTPFRIGLWVGARSTPNRTDDADEWVKKTRSSGRFAGGQSSPAQLTRCPWCGSEIKPGKHIDVDRARGRTSLYCGDRLGRCDFTRRRSPGEGLPAVVVDEEIYRLLPALVIATVDKFAQMPWKGRIAALFGQVSGRCERHGFITPDEGHPGSHPKLGTLPAVRVEPASPLRPPDLIIQDELHLIAGPLGTLVGLYETRDRQAQRLAGRRTHGSAEGDRLDRDRAPRGGAGRPGVRARAVGLPAQWARRRPTTSSPSSAATRAPRRVGAISGSARRADGSRAVLIRAYVAEMAAAQTLLRARRSTPTRT